MLKRIGAALLVAATLLTLAACSTRAPSDYILLHYGGGAEDHNFKSCVEPGTSGDGVVDDTLFALPTSLRSWAVLSEGGDSNKPFVVSSAKDPKTGLAGPQVKVYMTVKFYLNTDCSAKENSPVVKFWERTGRRPWKDGKGVAVDGEEGFNEAGWKEMLLATLVPVEVGVLQEESRKYLADDLDANTDGVWDKMERAIGPAFNQQLKDSVGGDYFCGSTYDRNKKPVQCPPVSIDIVSIDLNDPGIQDARNRVFIAKQDREAELLRVQTEVDKANKLAQANRNPAYLEFAKLETALEIAKLNLAAAEKCAANPNCTLIIGAPQDLGINTGK